MLHFCASLVLAVILFICTCYSLVILALDVPLGQSICQINVKLCCDKKGTSFFFFFSVICGHFGGYGLTLHSESDCDVTSSACYRPVSVGLEITAMAGGP